MRRSKSIVFKSYYWNGKFARIASGVGINHLSADKFSSAPVPVPPLAEQQRIVVEAERRLSIIDELEALVHANLRRAERLRQAVLKRAFEGKLVPQDPNDEPASVLLERIRAERQALPRKTMPAKPRPRRVSGRSQTSHAVDG